MKRIAVTLTSILFSAACPAQIVQFSGATQQLNYNIVTDFGAACNGDVQQQATTITISSGSAILQTSASMFTSGDVGKAIWVTGIGAGAATLQSTVKTFNSATEIVLATNALTTQSGTSQTITWGTDDTPAFMGANFNGGFRSTAVANQGNLQVVLTIPSGANCQLALNSGNNGNNLYPFLGIRNLIVSGYGATIANISRTQPMLWGGRGQHQDNRHSARVNTVSSGASCVTLITGPQATINNVTSNAGTIRLTVNSTAGYADGVTVPIQGIVGTGGLENVANGMKWLRVIDATTFDYFQSPNFQGTYTSGGTVGGDLTSLFTVGQYALMTGYMLQNYWDSVNGYGFPSNQQFFEFLKVASINVAKQEVCFETPLTYDYKSTWPQFNTGWAFEVDPGGPATLYALRADWDVVHEYRGLTIVTPLFQVITNGRSIKYKDVTVPGTHCVAPSQNITFSYENADMTDCNIEIDKLIKELNVTGGITRFWKFQSSSTITGNFTNHTIVRALNGGPQYFYGNNLTMEEWQPGAYAYGASYEQSCINCTITDRIFQGGLNQLVDNTAHTLGSMSGGVITIPNNINTTANESLIRVLVPNTNGLFVGLGGYATVFQILDVTQDFTNIYVQTNLAGGFPPAAANGTISIATHPAPKFTCTGCTGSATAVAVAPCTAQRPLYSCWNQTFTGGAAGTTAAATFQMWGELESLSFTNTTPYTGAGTLTWRLSQFNNWPMLTTGGTLVDFGTSPNGQASINVKLCDPTPCTRVLTPAGVTNAQSGDTLSVPPAGGRFGGASNSGPVFSANTPSDSPQVTIEMLTDQGLVLP